MASQLVYTSSPKGLKPGSFGFCVVACTRGMNERTIASLETLAGYRRVFTDQSAASRNPTAYSHLLFETPGGVLRILSRVADAGLDYSGRTNKIASFFNVHPSELVAPGPAALFYQPGLFVTEWTTSDSPRYFDEETVLPTVVSTPRGCDEWRRVAGDPSWAGVLAATVFSRKPVTLVVRPDQDVLRLFLEAIELLPPSDRWNATFSTYFMKTAPGVTCQWKAVMQGSPEEFSLRGSPGALLLDLAAPGALPPINSVARDSKTRSLIAAARGTGGSEKESSPSRSHDADAVPTPVPDAAHALPVAPPLSSDEVGPPPAQEVSVPRGGRARRKQLDYGRNLVIRVDAPATRKTGSKRFFRNLFALVAFGAVLLIILGVVLWSSGALESWMDRSHSVAEKKASETSVEEVGGDAGTSQKDGSDVGKPSLKGFDYGADDDEKTGSAASPKNGGAVSEDSGAKDNKSQPIATQVPPRNSSQTGAAPDVSNPRAPGGRQGAGRTQQDIKVGGKSSGSGGVEDRENEPDQVVTDEEEEPVVTAPPNRGARSDVAIVVNEIHEALNDFSATGNAAAFKDAESLTEEYRYRFGRDEEFIDASDRFDEIQEAISFRSLRDFKWNDDILNGPSPYRIQSVTLSNDIYSFFSIFPGGVIRFSTQNNGLNEPTTTVDFYLHANVSSFNWDCNVGSFNLDFNVGTLFSPGFGRRVVMEFDPNIEEEDLAQMVFSRSLKVEAYAGNQAAPPVFSNVEYGQALFDRSTLRAQETLDLGNFIGSKKPELRCMAPGPNSLVVEYVPSETSPDEFTVETDVEEARAISGASKSKQEGMTTLRYSDKPGSGTLSAGAEYAFVFEFKYESRRNEFAVKSESVKILQRVDFPPAWKKVNSFPAGVSRDFEMTFRVRYRTTAEQPLEETPIMGYITVPLSKVKL